MFPTLSYLFEYLFHVRVNLQIQTLGFMVVVAFIAAYLSFVSEFKRKEKEGLIHARQVKVVVGKPASLTELLLNALLGFIFGYKVIGAVVNYQSFINDPKNYLLSAQGNLLIGLLCCAGWTYWAYSDRKKEQLPEPVTVEETVHPYQLMVKISIWAGIIGLAGAKLFDAVEHLNLLVHEPLKTLFSSSGYTYYGAFICGTITFYYMCVKNGVRLAHAADIGAPGIMLAYGIGRIGCQLSGDGDWGIVNTHIKPDWLSWLPDWMWSFNFPHNEINMGQFMPGCTGNYCHVLPVDVYPTSFYEAVICIGLFFILTYIAKYLTIPGMMSMTYLITSGTERFLIEYIKVNIRYNVLGFHLTQAQEIALVAILIGIVGMIYILTPIRKYFPEWLTRHFYNGGVQTRY